MKLLMHMCCAPCAVYPVLVVQKTGIEVEGFFYNPNIHPVEEYEKRLKNVKIFSAAKKLKVHFNYEFKQDLWENFSQSDIERCEMCYDMRLDKAAKFAKENGFDAFTTSLLVSPYQKHENIIEIAQKYAKKYNVKFYYSDFRVGYREGQQMAKEMGLYRQKYCGCIKSIK